MTLKALIVFIVCIFSIFAVSAYRDYLKTGGFEEDTNQLFGYQYADINQLKSPKECDDLIEDDPEDPPPKEWIKGCKHYFEVNN